MGHVIDFAVAKAPKMFEEALYGLESGTIQPRRQDAAKKSPFRCYPRIPSDSKIDWCKSAREIDTLIRASSDPYSGAYSYLKTGEMIRKVYIWKSRVILEETEDIGTPGHIIKNETETGESWVFTGKGILAICLVQYEGEDDRFGPGNVWRSIRMRFGVDIEDEILRLHLALSRLKPGLSDMVGPTGKE
jgi:methionyl-tRNA formyltransferase